MVSSLIDFTALLVLNLGEAFSTPSHPCVCVRKGTIATSNEITNTRVRDDGAPYVPSLPHTHKLPHLSFIPTFPFVPPLFPNDGIAFTQLVLSPPLSLLLSSISSDRSLLPGATRGYEIVVPPSGARRFSGSQPVS